LRHLENVDRSVIRLATRHPAFSRECIRSDLSVAPDRKPVTELTREQRRLPEPLVERRLLKGKMPQLDLLRTLEPNSGAIAAAQSAPAR
jgi:hypothetical protein